MGYDNNECLECYCCCGSNNPCDNYSDICLKCIHEICESASNRVVYALKNFDWACSGTCTKCNSNGITIDIPLCDHHLKQRNCDDSSDPNEDFDCYLCDYEGECHYEKTEVIKDLSFCRDCELNLQTFCQGEQRRQWAIGYRDKCSSCNLDEVIVQNLSLCNYHIGLTK